MPKPVFKNLTFSETQACKSAILLTNNISVSTGLLEQVRRAQGAGRRKVQVKNPEEKHFVGQLAQIGVVNVEEEGSFWVRSNGDWNYFKGDWLEVYVWNEARNQRDDMDCPLFNQVEIGLEIPSGPAKKEIDVACLYKAQLIHCSCKTGKDAFSTDHLDELSAVSNLIGGQFCTRLLVTNEMLSELQKQKREEFLEQARQRKIVVVAGEYLPSIGDIFRKQAIDPGYKRV